MHDITPDAQKRRDQIRERLLDAAPGIARRRRQRRRAIHGGGAICLVVLACMPFLVRGPSSTPVDVDPAPLIVHVATDSTIVDRLAFEPRSTATLLSLSDDDLLEELSLLGYKAGLIRQNDSVTLTGDVLANLDSDETQTGES